MDVVNGEGILLSSEEGAHAFYGTLYETILPMINGSRTSEDIARLLEDKISNAEVFYLIGTLEQEGYLAESTPEVDEEMAAFWHALGIPPREAIQTLSSRSVRVHALGTVDAKPLSDALRRLGVNVVDHDEAALHAVLTNDYLRAELNEINRFALESSRTWLLARPVGVEIWIGPLFLPGVTACYQCLSTRLRRHRVLDQFVAEKNGMYDLPSAKSAALGFEKEVTALLAASEIAKVLVGARGDLRNRILALNTKTWVAANHVLTKQPHCTSCGQPVTRETSSFTVSDHRRIVSFDGGYRTATPDETLNRYGHLVSPVTGIVSALTRVHSSAGFASVYTAGHNTSLRLQRLDSVKHSLRNASSGKGRSDSQAKASALCEALERYSGEYQGNETVISATLEELGGAGIHPNAVMLYSESQYEQRESWNQRKSRFTKVPERFNEHSTIDWTPVWSLSKSKQKYVPTELLYFGVPASGDNNRRFCHCCSNGNAAGNTLEEAVLQGLLELIERDAVAIWWYNRISRSGLQLNSFEDYWITELIEHYANIGREVWALDITSDLGIPVFVAASRKCHGTNERILLGFGCHLDGRVAVQRAFAELNQMHTLSREDSTSRVRLKDSEIVWWLHNATVKNQPFLAPNEEHNFSKTDTGSQGCLASIAEQIGACKRILESRDMEVLVVDQTRADVALPVVKVIVPGLRHFWARFAPGRLYDIPVQMRWLRAPLSEQDLNPIPMFL
jgi:oxazoline/thiazoline synthase